MNSPTLCAACGRPILSSNKSGKCLKCRQSGGVKRVRPAIQYVFGGPFDATLAFGEQDLSSAGAGGRPARTREVVQLTMSWGHLKSMIPLLAKIVAQYEQAVGEVPSPGFDQLWKE
jgi:hypothetical protein